MIYDTLASFYDALVKDDQASDAWVKWITKYKKTGSFLELACGSGEITLKLANLGFDLTALDLSSSMIQEASAKDVEKKIHFVCQDMKDLSNFGSFDAIACLCDSFNYILSKQEVKDFFEMVYYHLNPEGYFFFDTHSMDRLEEFEEEFNETGEIDGVDYQWSILSEEDYIYQDFAFYLPNGRTIQEHHMQRVYDPIWLKEVLEQWFRVEAITTDFDLEGVQPGEKIFYVCRRKV